MCYCIPLLVTENGQYTVFLDFECIFFFVMCMGTNVTLLSDVVINE